MNVDAQIDERLRHVIAGSRDVADVEARRNLHVDTRRVVRRRAIEIGRAQHGLADGMIALFVVLTVIGGHGGELVGTFFQPCRRHVKIERLIVIVLRRRELLLACLPAVRQIEPDRTFGWALYVTVDRHDDFEGLRIQGNNARGGGAGNRDGRTDNQRFENSSGSRYTLYRLNDLGGFEGHTVESEAQFRGQRIRGRGQIEVVEILDVVVGLFDVRTREVRPRVTGVWRGVNRKSHVRGLVTT